ncbi:MULTISPECIES: hypothetical protein [Trichocoleus]|uniref:DUF2127 domain-containing protein n=1 Tax=Trichocoleus desertorum GB2-A4 TaxID=2933944 RepID=A0ABV0JBK8_9CYAN|nr:MULTISPECIES: hypothetical protein [unclassified Trichocoleus]MBD1860953.1 hypothetical protein [Trichocoleus sp. FACHB-46]MBD2097099.1 hypothetical protein [Trichocoleus sp. FACHB-591]MBD2122710.1 hypothetical protein [Trichocoleus sp. FACHB-262]
MNFNDAKKTLSAWIKVISIVLITGAIALESWNFYAGLANIPVPSSLNIVFAIERFAVAVHLVEGIVAAVFASSRQQRPLQYGVYTFFVGTVGLLELFTKVDPE